MQTDNPVAPYIGAIRIAIGLSWGFLALIALLATEIAVDPKTAAVIFHLHGEAPRLFYLKLLSMEPLHRALLIAISLFVLFWPARAIWSLLAFLRVYKDGDIYSLAAADALRRFGKYFTAIVIFWLLGSFAMQLLLIAVQIDATLSVDDFQYHSGALGTLMPFVLVTVGALIAMIGSVMADAARMADEHRHIL